MKKTKVFWGTVGIFLTICEFCYSGTVQKNDNIGTIGNDTKICINQLKESLISKKQDEFVSAVKKIVSIGYAATPDILTVIDDHKESTEFRILLCSLLGEIRDPGTISDLATLASNEKEDVLLRSEAIFTLAKIGDQKAAPVILKQMEDNDYHVRAMAALAVGILKIPSTTDTLFNFVKNDPNELVKIRAIRSLGSIGDQKAQDYLVESCNSKMATVSITSINMLGNLKSVKAVEPLLKIIEEGTYEQKASAIMALGKIGSPKAVDSLTQVLDKKDNYFSMIAAESLSKIGIQNEVMKQKLENAINETSEDKFAQNRIKKAYKSLFDKNNQ